MDKIQYKINSRIIYLQETIKRNKAKELIDRYDLGLNDGYVIADECNLKFLQKVKQDLENITKGLK